MTSPLVERSARSECGVDLESPPVVASFPMRLLHPTVRMIAILSLLAACTRTKATSAGAPVHGASTQPQPMTAARDKAQKPAADAAPKNAPAPAASQSAYTGHGAESIPPEVLAKYRPTPLPSELERKIQSMFDLSGP